ncbi:Thioredoxin-like protein Clot [Leucoagaricus sp. SymC.cos]|nr:Thioredoxin-like protein Clot [Leucoagaricus sp. SymC.cos]
MPLNTADHGSIGPYALLTVPEKYLIFYSSPVHGVMWCPDCLAVDSLVKETFSKETAPDALIVYVGDKPQWRAESNPYRKEPWSLQSIPTIVKLEDVRIIRLLGITESSAFIQGGGSETVGRRGNHPRKFGNIVKRSVMIHC